MTKTLRHRTRPQPPQAVSLRHDVAALLAFLEGAAPDTVRTYQEMEQALDGDPSQVPRHRIYQTMRALNRRLLESEQRYWHVVRGVGYRLLKAEEHLPVAMVKRQRAEHQMRQGLMLIQQVRQEELTEAQRQANAGMLLVMGGLYAAIRDTEARQMRQEGVLDELRRRVDTIEEGLGTRPTGGIPSR